MDKTDLGVKSTRTSGKLRKVSYWFLVSIIILFVVAYLGIGAFAAEQLTKPQRVFNPELNPGVYNLEYEEFFLPARDDGLKIATWYIPSDENNRVIIMVHGRDNSRTNGFVDNFVNFTNELHKAGFSVMMIDLRGHGLSADSRYHFGITERLDVLGAVDWLIEHGYQPRKIGVMGYSLGAASVIGAASEDQNIGPIWIDNTYADIKPVIEGILKTESGLPQIFLYSVELMTRALYGYEITTSRPVEEIGKINPRPILMAHCEKDKMIPISHMDQLLAEVQNVQTWVIQDCDQANLDKVIVPDKYNHHALGYNLHPEEYQQKLIQFFDENL